MKELVRIEYTYNTAESAVNIGVKKNRVITLGIFDCFEDACDCGNKAIKEMEDEFGVNESFDTLERFSSNGSILGGEKRFISRIGYLKAPFSFYATITKLEFISVADSIKEIMEENTKYINQLKIK